MKIPYKESKYSRGFMNLFMKLITFITILVIATIMTLLVIGAIIDFNSVSELVLNLITIIFLLILCYIAYYFWSIGREINQRIKDIENEKESKEDRF